MEKIKKASDADNIAVMEHGHYTIECFDPYGFHYIHAHIGRTPDCLLGAYTTQEEALLGLDIYVREQKVNKYKVKPVEKVN